MPPLVSFKGSSIFLNFASVKSVSSMATSIIGLFSRYAFLAIAAALAYPIIGFNAVTKIGFLFYAFTSEFLIILKDLNVLSARTFMLPLNKAILFSKL